jgi:hypothetical protein
VAFDEPLGAESAVGISVTSATQEEALEQLPPGMLLTRRDDQWAVVQPQEKRLTIVAQSTSLQTAIQMACNREKGPARSRDF